MSSGGDKPTGLTERRPTEMVGSVGARPSRKWYWIRPDWRSPSFTHSISQRDYVTGRIVGLGLAHLLMISSESPKGDQNVDDGLRDNKSKGSG
jgi:hypothetical protein